MHDTTHEDERESARPNDRTRAALLEVLDIADRAGVQVAPTVYVHDGRPAQIVLQGRSGAAGRLLLLTDALRLALRTRAAVERDEPTRGCPHTALRSRLPGTGVALTIICEPTYAQLEAAVVEAVLRS